MLSHREKQIFTLSYYLGIGNNYIADRPNENKEEIEMHAIGCAKDVLDEFGINITSNVLSEIHKYLKEMDEVANYMIKDVIQKDGI